MAICFSITCHLCPEAGLMQWFWTDKFVCMFGQDVKIFGSLLVCSNGDTMLYLLLLHLVALQPSSTSAFFICETISEGWAIISSFCSFGSTGFGLMLSKTCLAIAPFPGRVNMLSICKNNPLLFSTFTEENPWTQKGKTVQWIVQFRICNWEHSWEPLPLICC